MIKSIQQWQKVWGHLIWCAWALVFSSVAYGQSPGCGSMPSEGFGGAGVTEKRINNLNVTRTIYGTQVFSSAGKVKYCSDQPNSPAGMVFMGNDLGANSTGTPVQGATSVKYTFDQPVASAEIYLIGFGGSNPGGKLDQVVFATNAGAGFTLSKTYDCNNIVSLLPNGAQAGNDMKITDAAIKITGNKPFTELTIRVSATDQSGFFMELCPDLRRVANIVVYNVLQSQQVCVGTTPVFKGKLGIDSAYTGGIETYQLQVKKNGSSTWENVPGMRYSGTNLGEKTFTPSQLSAATYHDAKVRVAYTYTYPTKFTGTATAYSQEVDLKINQAEITSVTLSPTSFNRGTPTNVTYTIQGTPNAEIRYEVDGTAKTATLNASGHYSESKTVTDDTYLKVTEVKIGACTQVISQSQTLRATAPLTPSSLVADLQLTQLIGCGTGVNADKAEVTAKVEGTGYQFDFGTGWQTSNKGWLTAGNHTVRIKQGSNVLTKTITVPAKPATPTFTPQIEPTATAANVYLLNNQPTYQYSYTYNGETSNSFFIRNMPEGANTVQVNYTAPSLEEELIFYDDFGKYEGGAAKGVSSPYANPNVYFAPLDGSGKQYLNNGSGAARTSDFGLDACYTVASVSRPGVIDYTNALLDPPHYWRYPNDKDGDPNGRVLCYNSVVDNPRAVIYKRKATVRPHTQVNFSAYVYNTIAHNNTGGLGANWVMPMQLQVFATEADADAGTAPLFTSYQFNIPRCTSRDDWHPMKVTGYTGSHTELFFVVRMLPGGGNDVAVDNIRVSQPVANCANTLPVTVNVPASSVKLSGTYDCTTQSGKIEITGLPAGYTYSLDGGTFQSSGTFNNVSIGTHTLTYKKGNPNIIFKEDFRSGEPYLLPTDVVPPPFVGRDHLIGYPADILPEGHYQVANKQNLTKNQNWGWISPQDHTGLGAQGRYLAINHGANANQVFYKKTLKVAKNKAVTLRYYGYNLNPDNHPYNANIRTVFVDKASGAEIPASVKVEEIKNRAHDNDWTEVTHTFNPGEATELELRFTNTNNSEGSNDFVIDDILVTQSDEITETVEITNPTMAPILTNQRVCTGTKVSEVFSGYNNLKWYTTAAMGGTALAATDVLTARTYYISQVENGCESPRTQVTITLSAAVAPPTLTTPQEFCVGEGKKLSDIAANNYVWYDAATGGNPLSAETLLETKSYYVAATNADGCESITRQEIRVTLKNKPTLTYIGVSPTILNPGANTLTYTIKGTPGAKATYTFDGGAPEELTLNAMGVATVTKTGVSHAVVLDVTKLEKAGLCDLTGIHYKAEVTTTAAAAAGATCSQHPTPQFPTQALAKATMNGIEVTRRIIGTERYEFVPVMNDPLNGFCYNPVLYGHPAMNKREEGRAAQKIIYTFDKPITQVQVWESGMIRDPADGDGVKISVNCGGTLTTSITNCENRNNWGLTFDEDGERAWVPQMLEFTQGAVLVTSSKPFTELVLKVRNNIGRSLYGYTVELCPLSLRPAAIDISAQPQALSACVGQAGETLSATAQLTGATTGDLSYVWQQSETPMLESSWTTAVAASGVSGTIPATGGTATLTLNDIKAADHQRYYRVRFSYGDTCGADVEQYSRVAQLTVNTVAVPVVDNTQVACPTQAPTTFDLSGLVTPAAGHTLKWYEAFAGGTALAAAPQVQRQVTQPTTYTYYVSQVNATGCESPRTQVTYKVAIGDQRPVITLPATDLALNCEDTNIDTQVNAWLATAQASTPCGEVSLTNNFAAVRPGNLCNTDQIEVTFTTTDLFGGKVTATKAIKLVHLNTQDDTATIARNTGGTINVLANDRINGGLAQHPTNVVVTLTDPAGTGATLTPDGKIQIPGGTLAANTYPIRYTVCDAAHAAICKTHTLTLTVTDNNLVATNDDSNDVLIRSTTVDQYVRVGGAALNILANDLLGSAAPTLAQVEIQPTNTLTGLSINRTTAEVKVAAGTAAGTYQLKYKLKEKGTENLSNEATITVVVTSEVSLLERTPTYSGQPSKTAIPTEAGNALTPVRIPGNPAVPAITEVVIRDIVPATPRPGSSVVPKIDPATGKVLIPQGTPAGDYTIKYKVCDKANPQSCSGEITATVKVTAGILLAEADLSNTEIRYATTEQVVQKDGANLNLLANDKLDGVAPTLAQVSLTATHNEEKVTIDPATATVKVAAGTTAGVYTLRYTLTEQGQTTASNEVEVKVVVKNNLEVNPITIPASNTPSTRGRDKELGNILNGVKINDEQPTLDKVMITVPTPATPKRAGAAVPYIDPLTGKVILPPAVPDGTYNLTYQVCDAAQGEAQHCKTQTLAVVVDKNTIEAQEDDYTNAVYTVPFSATEARIIGDGAPVSVLDNDTLAGLSVTPSQVEIVEVTGDGQVHIDRNTGYITVGANASIGEHTLTYKIKEKGTDNLSQAATVKVVVDTDNKLEGLSHYEVSSKKPTDNSTKVIGNIFTLGQVKYNGVLQTAPGQLTITNIPSYGVPASLTIDETTGEIKTTKDTPDRTYWLSYMLCDQATPQLCKDVRAVVRIGLEEFKANDDSQDNTFLPVTVSNTATVVKKDGTNAANILDNDKLGDMVGLNTNQVTILTTATSPYLSTDNSGKVTVAANTPAGLHRFKYKLLDKINLGNETDEATVTIAVKNNMVVGVPTLSPAKPAVDNTPREIGDVLEPTTINGQRPNAGEVTINVVTPALPTPQSPAVPYIDTTTGKILVPKGTPIGSYPITYEICDQVNIEARTCKRQTVTINVAPNDIEAKDDRQSSSPDVPYKVQKSSVPTELRDSGNAIVNVLDNDVLGTRTGFLDTDIVEIEALPDPSNIKVDVTTGRVLIPANTPAGEYNISYRIKERGNTASPVGHVFVAVTNRIEVETPVFRGKAATGTTPAEIGNVIDKVKLNGTPAQSADLVPITIVTPASPQAGGTQAPTIEPNGKVLVPQGTAPGTYTIVYKLCDHPSPQSQTCQDITTTIEVTPSNLQLNPDNTARVPKTGGEVAVLGNDTLNGVPATTDNVEITIDNDRGIGATIGPDGKIIIPNNVAPGEHTITYKVCEKGQTSQCQTAEVKISVPANITLTDDAPATIPHIGGAVDVLANDTVNGGSANRGNVDIAITNDGNTGADIDPDGKIRIPEGVSPGEHTITYKVCEKGQTDNCQTKTLKITSLGELVLNDDDTARIPKTGGQVDVLSNDILSGTPVTTDTVSIEITDADGTHATIDNGKIKVPAPGDDVTPGEHTITYKVCQKNTTNCQTKTVKVSIPARIQLNDDDPATIPHTGGTVDVLTNDRVNGGAANTSNVDITITNPDGTGATIDSDGKIRIPARVTPGEHTITYKVCEKGQTDNCQTKTQKITSLGELVLNPDNTARVTKVGGEVDVLSNDTLNGDPVTTDTVTLEIEDADGSGATVENGKIKVPANAAPGEHTITYKVCQKNTTNCQTATVKVVVLEEDIAANDDNYTVQWSATATTVKDNNRREVNVLSNDAFDGTNGPTTTQVDIVQTAASDPDKVFLDTVTGKVKIAADVQGGTYTVTYTIQPKGRPSPVSAPATVTIVVKNKVELSDDRIPVRPSDDPTPAGNILDNVRVNGRRPQAGEVTLTVTPPAGSPVPSINPNTGEITVPGNVPAGDYPFQIQVCDRQTPPTCQSKQIVVKVNPNQDLEAVDDPEYKVGTAGGTSTINVLDNDKLGTEVGLRGKEGITVQKLRTEPNIAEVTNNIVLGTDGFITVKPGIAVGNYELYYEVHKDRMSAIAKVRIRVTDVIAGEDNISVERPLEGQPDKVSEQSVLGNDNVASNERATPETVQIEEIEISNVDPSGPAPDGKISLDPATGKIVVKPGAPIGEYTVKYKIRPKESTSDADWITGEDKVKITPNFSVSDKDFTNPPVMTNQSPGVTKSVLDGDTLEGQPLTPADVTLTITDQPGISENVTFDDQGRLVIPQGTPSGTYPIRYKIKSNAYGIEKEVTVMVKVENDITLEFYNAISTDEGSPNNAFIIKNIQYYPDNNLKIYNRYGVLVFDKDNYTNEEPFRGISEGRATLSKDSKLPQGTYFYILEYKAKGESLQKSGWLYVK
ncbi:hypothetical protein HMPREF1551_02736 [Capnocytophaga sp. oral taxon 863 str. F0517]|uniref:Ig-like domain-containing protein n=1 Tax=Capnocytophaga sp. oral taxon 863 TaxID=1227265 RepID=UPI00039722D3|nr:gliding motility-associated C-terminal domain-containing protein [Capnocytophaga sp. oral taxon 863]ERI61267.1 hypothetical protein HMPREF1551_02736 [Capnocytophaga sp. oral taxon 863 str. F0517]